MYVGSTLYVLQISKLAKPMKLSRVAVLFSLFNACWPATLWTISLACLLDEYPLWLLEGLRRVESHLPSVLHASLFFDPPALYPVCELLHGVVAHEEARLQTARRHAAGPTAARSPTSTWRRSWCGASPSAPAAHARPLSRSPARDHI